MNSKQVLSIIKKKSLLYHGRRVFCQRTSMCSVCSCELYGLDGHRYNVDSRVVERELGISVGHFFMCCATCYPKVEARLHTHRCRNV